VGEAAPGGNHQDHVAQGAGPARRHVPTGISVTVPGGVCSTRPTAGGAQQAVQETRLRGGHLGDAAEHGDR
jgi:hypothetical protein